MAMIGKLYTNSEKLDIKWRIGNFLSFWESGDNYYASPIFYFSGASWCLNIYPDGDLRQNSKGYISLYLFRNRPNPIISSGECSFGLENLDWKENGKMQPAGFMRRKRGYGVPRFLLRSEFLEKQEQLIPSNTLTVLCSITFPKTSEDAGNNATTECSYCPKQFDVEKISSHEKKCINKPIKCPECSDVIALLNWYDHECETTKTEGDNATVKCSYCKENLVGKNISTHEKKCMHRRIKCPECSVVVALKYWYEHKCQIARTEGYIAIKAAPSYSKENLDVDKIQEPEKERMHKSVKCSECSSVVLLQSCYDHEYQMTRKEDIGSLLRDYKKVLLDGMNHDLFLNVGGRELRAHRDILRARSRVFESMLTHDMMEKNNSGAIYVPDCDPEAMEMFLTYVYCGKVETLDQTNMLELYYIADKYDMQGLKAECYDFIKKSLSPENICEVIQVALKHSDTGLQEYATEYFMNNVLDIMRTVEWQCFLKDNSTVGNELLIKAFEKLKM